ncbi:ABC transporter permease [Hydrogenophaga pseudoflava]|jgi:lipoprotein-releasing system permease protein|uniref:ABC transporter permease n=1 Tax=Hydrogenophaga pseudoflava TaxID=47421 RepID=UPI0008269575|nr:FtsX-like permease family protein [Hydrogenophaga pseudoflava]
MLLGFESLVAIRFLREGRMQSLLIIVGVAAGVAVVAYISALITGLQRNTIEKTLGAQAHVTVSPLDERVLVAATPPGAGASKLEQTQARAQRPRSIDNWRLLLAELEAMPQVAAVSPMVSAAGLAVRGEASRAIALMGVELERYDRIVKLRSKVVTGTARLEPGEGLIGLELAQDLGVQVGDRIGIVANGVEDALRITALVDLGVKDLNRRTVIVPLRTAQSLVGLPGSATGLDLALHDIWAAQDLAGGLSARWPYKAESWQQANAQLVSALNAQSVSTSVIRGVVMIVVVLGIASVLVVSVVQKQREIGILRAMGATRGQVLRVFLLQGLIVGALGSALGVLLAVALIWLFTHFVRGSDGLPLFNITLDAGLALRIAALATVCGLLASVAPARRASRLDPAQAIRL